MPPKVKISREDIVSAAVDLVRESGAQAINARTLASRLECSTQPIFSNFASMDELRLATVRRADALCNAYMKKEIESGKYPVYKATGMAYIRFAKEEKELFKLLYMRDRTGEAYDDNELSAEMEAVIKSHTGLDGDAAKLFHLEIWAYVHGIAAMFATGFFNLEWELVSRMITDAYRGLRKQYGLE